MYVSYVIKSSCREVVRRFQANYPGVRVPSREAVRLLVNKFSETESILDKKRNVKRSVLTEQKVVACAFVTKRKHKKLKEIM